MVGKLWLNLGEDYAYDIRRARAVAEGAADPGGGGGTGMPDLKGPFGDDPVWWFDPVACEVWFDVDSDSASDVGVPVARILGSDLISDELKAEIRPIAEQAGCLG